MANQKLLFARAYEKEMGSQIPDAIRPKFHLTPCAMAPDEDYDSFGVFYGTALTLPEGMSRNDFRDPKIWQDEDGSYRCVVGSCRADLDCNHYDRPGGPGHFLLHRRPGGNGYHQI